MHPILNHIATIFHIRIYRQLFWLHLTSIFGEHWSSHWTNYLDIYTCLEYSKMLLVLNQIIDCNIQHQNPCISKQYEVSSVISIVHFCATMIAQSRVYSDLIIVLLETHQIWEIFCSFQHCIGTRTDTTNIKPICFCVHPR